MLIALHIRNYRSIRSADLDFKADRDDMSVTKTLKEGTVENYLLPSGSNRLIVPVKNIIGLQAFGKTSVIKALQSVVAIASGEDPRRYYHPCAEDSNYRDADCELGINFSFYDNDQLLDASYTVRFNRLGIVLEELSIENEQQTSFKTYQGAIIHASEDIVKADSYREKMLASCLDDNEQQIKCFLAIAAAHGICHSVYHCIKNEFIFLFLQDLSTHSVISYFENFCKEITPCFKNNAKDAEDFALTQLSHFLRDLTGIINVKHKLDLNTGVNSLTLEHKINKSKGLLKSAISSNNEYSYELDLDDEGHGVHALILILMTVIKSLVTGAVTVIDDFNNHLTPFAQLYIPRLYKTERNVLLAQLIIVHNGDRVMIANGEDCADEVCCIARTPEQGSVLTSGRSLLKNHHVEFSHHNALAPEENEAESKQNSAPSAKENTKSPQHKFRMPTGNPFLDKLKSPDEVNAEREELQRQREEFMRQHPEAAAELNALIRDITEPLEDHECEGPQDLSDYIPDDDADEIDETCDDLKKSMKEKKQATKHKPHTATKKKRSRKNDDFFFESELES